MSRPFDAWLASGMGHWAGRLLTSFVMCRSLVYGIG